MFTFTTIAEKPLYLQYVAVGQRCGTVLHIYAPSYFNVAHNGQFVDFQNIQPVILVTLILYTQNKETGIQLALSTCLS